MATNLPTYYVDSAQVTARDAEYADADFVGGMNKGAACAPGIGINTGNDNPPANDWPRIEQLAESNQIGDVASGLFCEDATFGDDALVGFGPADASTVADAEMTSDVAGTGFSTFNRTGATVPIAVWCWGAINNP
jgi:hypothetical protein